MVCDSTPSLRVSLLVLDCSLILPKFKRVSGSLPNSFNILSGLAPKRNVPLPSCSCSPQVQTLLQVKLLLLTVVPLFSIPLFHLDPTRIYLPSKILPAHPI